MSTFKFCFTWFESVRPLEIIPVQGHSWSASPQALGGKLRPGGRERGGWTWEAAKAGVASGARGQCKRARPGRARRRWGDGRECTGRRREPGIEVWGTFAIQLMSSPGRDGEDWELQKPGLVPCHGHAP